MQLPRVHVHTLLPVALLAASSTSAAQVDQQDDGNAVPLGQRDAKQAAAAGALLRWTDAATTTSQGALVETHGGYDGTRQGATAEGRGEAVIYADVDGRKTGGVPLGVAIVGGGSYAAGVGDRRDMSAGFAGVKLQPLFQERMGVDLALRASYHSQGFSLRPVVVSELLLGRRFGDSQLLLNVAYAHPPEGDERSGNVRAAFLTRAVNELRVGVDSKLSLDLELDDDEPSGEPELELLAGPTMGYAFGHVGVTATGGLSAIKFRDSADTRVGATLSLGLGGAF